MYRNFVPGWRFLKLSNIDEDIVVVPGNESWCCQTFKRVLHLHLRLSHGVGKFSNFFFRHSSLAESPGAIKLQTIFHLSLRLSRGFVKLSRGYSIH